MHCAEWMFGPGNLCNLGTIHILCLLMAAKHLGFSQVNFVAKVQIPDFIKHTRMPALEK